MESKQDFSPDGAGPALPGLESELREVESRLDRLNGQALALCEERSRTGRELERINDFLATAPGAVELMEELTKSLFGEILDEIEANLSHAVREILGQDRKVSTTREVKDKRLFINFQMENQGRVEDIMTGQGGSVCNILSVGLRLIALSRLDPAEHRPFLVLDEQDCWLKPELVPRFMKLVSEIADRLGLQVLVISHHPVDLFAAQAKKVFGLKPSREDGAVVEVLRDVARA